MPILKTYSESYEKDGCYVHAPIEGASHPIPLQTPDITAQIYRELGYEPGEHVPSELTWKLYNAGLHWTESSGNTHHHEAGVEEAILGNDGPEFTEKQAKIVLSIIESYDGKFASELNSLIEEFDLDEQSRICDNLDSGSEAGEREYFGERFDSINNRHHLADLQTLEDYNCIYAGFYLEGEEGVRLCRVELKPEEINEYVESLISYNEYLSYREQGYSKEKAAKGISNKKMRERVQNSDSFAPAAFYSKELEALLCGLRSDRYEIIPESVTAQI